MADQNTDIPQLNIVNPSYLQPHQNDVIGDSSQTSVMETPAPDDVTDTGIPDIPVRPKRKKNRNVHYDAEKENGVTTGIWNTQKDGTNDINNSMHAADVGVDNNGDITANADGSTDEERSKNEDNTRSEDALKNGDDIHGESIADNVNGEGGKSETEDARNVNNTGCRSDTEADDPTQVTIPVQTLQSQQENSSSIDDVVPDMDKSELDADRLDEIHILEQPQQEKSSSMDDVVPDINTSELDADRLDEIHILEPQQEQSSTENGTSPDMDKLKLVSNIREDIPIPIQPQQQDSSTIIDTASDMDELEFDSNRLDDIPILEQPQQEQGSTKNLVYAADVGVAKNGDNTTNVDGSTDEERPKNEDNTRIEDALMNGDDVNGESIADNVNCAESVNGEDEKSEPEYVQNVNNTGCLSDTEADDPTQVTIPVQTLQSQQEKSSSMDDVVPDMDKSELDADRLDEIHILEQPQQEKSPSMDDVVPDINKSELDADRLDEIPILEQPQQEHSFTDNGTSPDMDKLKLDSNIREAIPIAIQPQQQYSSTINDTASDMDKLELDSNILDDNPNGCTINSFQGDELAVPDKSQQNSMEKGLIQIEEDLLMGAELMPSSDEDTINCDIDVENSVPNVHIHEDIVTGNDEPNIARKDTGDLMAVSQGEVEDGEVDSAPPQFTTLNMAVKNDSAQVSTDELLQTWGAHMGGQTG